MSDDFPFLRTIAEQPDEDGPRLVFADWLEERGDPYAEFIRLQCAPENAKNRARARELFEANWREWLTPVCSALDDFSPLEKAAAATWLSQVLAPEARTWLESISLYRWGYLRKDDFSVIHNVRTWEGEGERLKEATFSRGFADQLTLVGYGPLTADHLRRLGDCSPLRQLKLLWRAPGDFARLDGPHFATLSGLTLEFARLLPLPTNVAQADLVRSVCDSPSLPKIRSLSLENTEQAGDAVRALAAAPLMDRLHELRLPVCDEVRDAVAETNLMARLGRVDLHHNRFTFRRTRPKDRAAGATEMSLHLPHGEDGTRLVHEMLNSSAIAPLRRLRIANGSLNLIPSIVAAAERLANLVELDLNLHPDYGDTSRIRRGISDLVDSPHLGNLESLRMEVRLRDTEAFRALARCRGLPRLSRLAIHCFQEGDEVAQALATGPLPARLRELDLSNCGLTAAGVRALFGCRKFTQLEVLNLKGNDVPDRIKAQVRTRFGDRVVF